ncbi:MAG: hypothetical protein JW822_00140 [Spirochaetales bacterium]|nr:hypothetical protein [Spirochaetales bacterium]
MINKTMLTLFPVMLCFVFSCQDQALLRKQLYNLENTIIEEKLDLTEEQYTFSLTFIAPESLPDAKIILAYPNISQSEEISAADFARITNSLLGFSLELYAAADIEPLHAMIITENNKPQIDKQTVSLVLGDKISLLKNSSYELRITMPSKKNTNDRYTSPVLVVGTP